MNLLIASLNFTRAETLPSAIYQFAVDRSLLLSGVEHSSEWGQWWTDFLQWLSRPDILAIIIAWSITFTLIMAIMTLVGFGPRGIVAGTIAASFQSFMYGGFTPAGGIFATLTSMAMLGMLNCLAALLAGVVATGIAVLVWWVHT